MDAPTPFTADEIRAGCPSGRRVTTMTETANGTTTSVTTFVACRDEGAEMDIDGHRGYATWEELRAHASFPKDVTTITRETITTELGTHACLRYDVLRDGKHLRFWFAKDLPGMPIRSESVVEGRVVSTSTVVTNEYA